VKSLDSAEGDERQLSSNSESDADENIFDITLTTPERRVLGQFIACQSPYWLTGVNDYEEQEEFLKTAMEKIHVAKLKAAYMAVRRAMERLQSSAGESSSGSSQPSPSGH
jgi:Fe-S cluster assembly ATPase SufC